MKIITVIKTIFIIMVIEMLIMSYILFCYGSKTVKIIDNNTIQYKDYYYFYNDLFSSFVFTDKNVNAISKEYVWFCPLFAFYYFAERENKPEIIVQPRGSEVFFREDIDYKEFQFNIYIYYEQKENFFGVYSISNLLGEKVNNEDVYNHYCNKIKRNDNDSFCEIIVTNNNTISVQCYMSIYKFDKIILVIESRSLKKELYYCSDLLLKELKEKYGMQEKPEI